MQMRIDDDNCMRSIMTYSAGEYIKLSSKLTMAGICVSYAVCRAKNILHVNDPTFPGVLNTDMYMWSDSGSI